MPVFAELPERNGEIPGECEVADLRVPAEVHRHVHETAGIRSGLAEPYMEDIPPVNDWEKDILDFHTFRERDIGARRNMCPVRVVDGEIPGLSEVFECVLEVALNHFCSSIVVAPVDKICNSKPLPGRLCRVRARAIVIWFFSERVRA